MNVRTAPALKAGIAAMTFLGSLWSPGASAAWTGKGEGGLLISSGNTDGTSLNAKLDLARETGPWKNSFFLGALYGKSNGIQNSERIEAQYQLDRKIDERMFWFGGINVVRDQFSGFAYQASAVGGLGYHFIDNADTKLTGTAGIGYRRLEPQQLVRNSTGEVVQRINGASAGDLVGSFGLALDQNLTASTKLFEKLAVVTGSNNTTVGNDLGVQVAMSDRLALSVAYGIRYNTDPTVGVKKLDSLTTVNVVYNIK